MTKTPTLNKFLLLWPIYSLPFIGIIALVMVNSWHDPGTIGYYYDEDKPMTIWNDLAFLAMALSFMIVGIGYFVWKILAFWRIGTWLLYGITILFLRRDPSPKYERGQVARFVGERIPRYLAPPPTKIAPSSDSNTTSTAKASVRFRR